MCNKEQLVGYLYGELSDAERTEFEQHLASCADCDHELQGLRHTRGALATWTPAMPEFNVRVVPPAPPAETPRRRFGFGMVPQWALAAAASLLMIAGAAAIANLEVRYDANGLVVRTGWGNAATQDASLATADNAVQPPAPVAAVPAVARDEASEELKAQVAELAQRLQEVERTARAAGPVRVVAPERAGVSAAELRKILAESESRQRTELAVQMAKMWNDWNAARANYFVRVQQTFAPELQRQQRLIENVMFRTTGTQR